MKALLYSIALLVALFAVDAHAGLPQLNAICPGGLDVHVDQGGPVYVNGKEAKLKRSNDNYYEATDAKSGTVISITNKPDGSSDVSYTGKNRANGVCQVAHSSGPASASVPAFAAARETHPAAEKACLTAVAKKINVASSKLSVSEALEAEAGISVSVKVPGADAPWACMTDKNGKPWSVNYTGSEGKL